MNFDRSFGGRPWGIVIDHSRPIVEIDISGGSAPLTGGTSKVVSHGGPPKSFKRPRTDQPPEIPSAVVDGFGGPAASSARPRPIHNAIYSLLDIPISTSMAVRVGCWASSPIDSDALKGKVFPNFLQTLKTLKEGEFTDLNILQTFKNEFLRSPSEFPEFNLLMKKHSLPPPSELPGIKFSIVQTIDETRLTKMGDGPFPSASVSKCSDFPKEEVAKILKLIEREEEHGRWNSIDLQIRENLKRNEITFKSQYSYSTIEYRHCITANHISAWTQESSGIMWSGVYGIDDICVVTLTGQLLDWKRVHGCLASISQKLLLTLFRKCVLSELEDLADPTCKHREGLNMTFDPPFCVVSETPMAHDESGHEGASQAVAFVKGSGLLEQAKDSGGAIKLAISAFERLMGRKLEAEEIEVTVLFGRKSGNGYTRDLDICEIGDYLACT